MREYEHKRNTRARALIYYWIVLVTESNAAASSDPGGAQQEPEPPSWSAKKSLIMFPRKHFSALDNNWC